MFGNVQWSAERIAAMLERFRANGEREREMLRRSREQIAISQALLSLEVPKLWRTGRPNNATRADDASRS